MIRLRNPFKLDRSGATAAEFALTVPIVMVIIFSMIQMGVIFFANAGLQNALGQGARVATLWPTKSEAEIAAAITNGEFGLNPDQLDDPVFVYGTEGGQAFVEITVAYTADLNFIVAQFPGVRLEHTRRAYLP